MKAILLDIEGTTTDINFVHQVLFPYSRDKIPLFLKEHAHEKKISLLVENIKRDFLDSSAGLERVIDLILSWINEDKKIGLLKELQGFVWEYGYQNQEFKGHIYPDVRPCLESWKKKGINIYIYSSGSVHAQKLLFAHTLEGDLLPFIDGHFDTSVGHKKEVKSYRHILEQILLDAAEVLFLSDIEEELDAAKEAGIHTLHLNRDGHYQKSRHQIVQSFSEVHFA